MVEQLRKEVSLGDWLKIVLIAAAAMMYVVQNRSTGELIKEAVDALEENVRANSEAIVRIRVEAAEERGRLSGLIEASLQQAEEKEK